MIAEYKFRRLLSVLRWPGQSTLFDIESEDADEEMVLTQGKSINIQFFFIK